MSVLLENIIVGFTCRYCEHEETAGLDSLVISGTPMCVACEEEMEPDSTADILPERENRFWVHDSVVEDQPDVPMPFGEDTVGITDEEQGGVFLYLHKDNANAMMETLNAGFKA